MPDFKAEAPQVRETSTAPYTDIDVNVSPASLETFENYFIDPADSSFQGLPRETIAVLDFDRRQFLRRLIWDQANSAELKTWKHISDEIQLQWSRNHPGQKLTPLQTQDIFISTTNGLLRGEQSPSAPMPAVEVQERQKFLSDEQIALLAGMLQAKNGTVIHAGSQTAEFQLSEEANEACKDLQIEYKKEHGSNAQPNNYSTLGQRRKDAASAIRKIFENGERETIIEGLNPHARTLLEEVAKQSEHLPVDILSFLPSATENNVQRDKMLTVIGSKKEYKAPERAPKVYSLKPQAQQAPIAA